MKLFTKLLGTGCLALAALLVFLRIREGETGLLGRLKRNDSVTESWRPRKSTMGDLSLATWMKSKLVLVQISGQVKQPGPLRVPPETQLLEMIQRSGGPTVSADLRNISLIRHHETRIIDLDNPQDQIITVLPNDSIEIPSIESLKNTK